MRATSSVLAEDASPECWLTLHQHQAHSNAGSHQEKKPTQVFFGVFPSQKTIESERQKLLVEFEGLRQFLHDQEHILLGQLDKMEKSIAKRQNENITDLSKEITLLNKLITELEEKIQQPVLEFLKVRRLGL